MLKKRGQIWVETVIYTLIGLTIIGLLLSIITPRINQMNDKALVIQSINTLNKLDEQVSNTLIAAGNIRQVDLVFKKGEYFINPLEDSITFIIEESNLKYSEVGESTKQGEVGVLTLERNKKFDIYLSLNYDNLNITFNDEESNKTLSPSPVGYNLLIENKGRQGAFNQINIKQV